MTLHIKNCNAFIANLEGLPFTISNIVHPRNGHGRAHYIIP
ncbi:uncharacterized protein METZ01_LOCUS275754, partial [marine metagenome]